MGDIVESDDTDYSDYWQPETREKRQQLTRKKFFDSWVASAIAVSTVGFFYIYVASITYMSYLSTGKIDMALVNLVIGWVGGLASAIVLFFFGTSKSSSDKNEILAQRLPEPPKPDQ